MPSARLYGVDLLSVNQQFPVHNWQTDSCETIKSE